MQSLASINYSINERTISSLSIVDVLGNTQTKLSTNDHHPGENVMIVDLSELKPGIYFCKLISGELTLYTKFIKT
ncbi:MAG: T9SS type A sorting domain-containing protein [Bacteroidetes bacterium]|nr:T9SS type A sorting domain-containing protein [Bacteroidota bacterium]